MLTSVRQIRSLSSAQAAQALPVRLRGVVTVLSGWKSSFFLQDATSGISVDRTGNAPQLQPGQLVEIHGVTGPGRFAPVVNASRVTVLGKARMPSARTFTFDQLWGGAQDSQWVAIQGIVRSATVKPYWGHLVLFLEVDIGSGNLVTVHVHDFSEAGPHLSGVRPDRLPGSTISVRGVCGTVFNDKRQFVGLRLFVSNLAQVTIEQPSLADPFDVPLRPLGALLQFGNRGGAIARIRARGAVTYSQPGRGLYIQDGAYGVFVQSRQVTPVAPGALLEVVGYPAAGGYSPTLDDALFRVVAAPRPLEALAQSASGMITDNQGFSAAPYDSVLVQLKGLLVEEIPGADENLLLFKDGSNVFTARLPRSGRNLPVLAAGSLLRITGICVAKADQAHEARSFEILLRSPADLVVLKTAPWWTASHAWTLVWILAFAVVLASLIALWRQAGLRVLALTDQLTGLYNRRGFLLLAENQWQLAVRRGMSILILYIDVDRFKLINDTLGHKQGDVALQAVASPDFRAQLERRLAETLRHSNQKPGRLFDLSLSIGVLNCDDSLNASSIEDLLARADALMYEQKRNHRKSAFASSPVTVTP
jgi:GGDEF domain-containing protein